MHYWIFGVEALLIPNIWIYFLGKTSFVRHPERKFVVYRVFILARYLKFTVINTIKIPSHFPPTIPFQAVLLTQEPVAAF